MVKKYLTKKETHFSLFEIFIMVKNVAQNIGFSTINYLRIRSYNQPKLNPTHRFTLWINIKFLQSSKPFARGIILHKKEKLKYRLNYGE